MHADLKHVDKEGFPHEKEAQNILFFYHMIDEDLAIDKQYPNAVFLGRVVAKGHEVLHWYIHDADIADRIMYRLSLCKNPPVKFDYEIKDDKNWEYAHCLIDPLKTTPETEPNNNFNF